MGEEGFFGEHVAANYDESSAAMFDPAVVDPAIDVLADFAGDGAALEFAIGTGRIALPLAERGVRVAGIDDSEAMLARLREKPGASDRGRARRHDDDRVDGEFSLVYLVFNTIGNLTTQDAQVACFQNAAEHLRSGGRFVIETGVPALQKLPVGQTIVPFRADPAASASTSTTSSRRTSAPSTITFADGRVETGPRRVPLRLAGRARPDGPPRPGWRCEHRWAGWASGAVHGHQ